MSLKEWILPICDTYSQGQKVIPQRQKLHTLQCIFTFARSFTTLQLASILLCFWCQLKGIFILISINFV